MMMEMVLILVMIVMERPPPTLRGTGGEDGGDFPLLRGSGATGSDPSGRGQRLHRRHDHDKSRKKWGDPFSGETKAWLTGRPHAARFLGRVGHAHLDLVATLFWFFIP
jgi:hypothetical protein